MAFVMVRAATMGVPAGCEVILANEWKFFPPVRPYG